LGGPDDLLRFHSVMARDEMSEQVEGLHGQMTPEERRTADLRVQDHGWPSIATRLGGTPEARRKQWARAVSRINTDQEQPP